MAEFSFAGHYRVQSRRNAAFSMLEGDWLRQTRGMLTDHEVNDALSSHAQWTGKARVALRPANVTVRTGKFSAEPDILYKHELFVPAEGTPRMGRNIVDVSKAEANWRERSAHARLIFGDSQYDMIESGLRDLDLVIANEYYLHEAGHFVGYDVLSKYDEGYFRPGGKTAWPLIFLEELRADLHAFGFSADLLPPERAVQAFLYNVALRFGVHRQGIVEAELAPYGLVPYLLFCVLRDVGAVSVARTRGRQALLFLDPTPEGWLRTMRACAEEAERELTAAELRLRDPIERAMVAAGYIRRRLRDANAVQEFCSLMNQPSERSHHDHTE